MGLLLNLDILLGWHKTPNAFKNTPSDPLATKVWVKEEQDLRCSNFARSERCLAFFRLAVAVCAIAYMIVIFSFTFEKYFDYLTNWGNAMMAITFTVLTIGHCRAGHFKKQVS